VVELRVPSSGLNLFFDDFDLLAERATAIETTTFEKAAGIYVTLNPLIPRDWMRINSNRSIRGRGATDLDVRERYWIPIDIDPVRAKGHEKDATTADELEAAMDVHSAVVDYLRGLGWNAAESALMAYSGNGLHSLWRVDLPAKDGGFVKRVLDQLSDRFTNKYAKVDTSVFNPSRIFKLYGTTSRKGIETEDRPHRRAEFIYLPKVAIDKVAPELLIKIGGELPILGTDTPQVEESDELRQILATSQRQNSDRVQAFLNKHIVDAAGPKVSREGDGEKWTLGCRYVTDGHAANTGRAGSAYIIADQLGGIKAGCMGDRCRGKSLVQLLEVIDPSWRFAPELEALSHDLDYEPSMGVEEFETTASEPRLRRLPLSKRR
jgi:hypothetical protein